MPISDLAILVSGDRRYLPYGSFLLEQIVRSGTAEGVDLYFASGEDLKLPRSLHRLGVQFLKVTLAEIPKGFCKAGINPGYMLKMLGIKHLSKSYRRVLYLDSDVYLEGGRLRDLLAIELGGKAIGAVLDLQHYLDPAPVSLEGQLLGWGSVPYFNTGVLLVDCAAFLDQRVFERWGDFAALHPEVLIFHDQSALNGALMGDFAELSPAWNWLHIRYLETHRPETFQVALRHFAGPWAEKAWSLPGHPVHAPYAEAYRRFFAEHWRQPAVWSVLNVFFRRIFALRDPVSLKTTIVDPRASITLTLEQQMALAAYLARHPDPLIARPALPG